MAAKHWAILVGISVISACGQKSSEPAAQGSATPTPKAAISAPARPELPAAPSIEPSAEPAAESGAEPASVEPAAPVGPVPAPAPAAATDTTVSPSTAFERQTRDPTWAGPTESEIKKRVTKLGARVDTAECRHDRCLIALRGPEAEMTDVLAKLESPTGLAGFAQSIYLTAPVEQGGQLVVRAYATFDR